MMSRIKEHFSNLINSFKEPKYEKEYGDWFQAKQEELLKLDEKIENKMYSSDEELRVLELKRSKILSELNGSLPEE